MYVTRHMEPVVLEVSSQYPALLIVGPRQVGKTTMLEHLIEVEGRGRDGRHPGRPHRAASLQRQTQRCSSSS